MNRRGQTLIPTTGQDLVEVPVRGLVLRASDRGQCYTAGLGVILGLFGSDRAGTALARQQSVARFWQVVAYQLNVFALT